jgi:hypothetical protein
VKDETERLGRFSMDRLDEPKISFVNYLAGILNKKYAEKWKIDMPKGKYRKITQDVFATNEQMEVAAYYQWQNRGCPSDDSLTDWLNAEQEFAPEAR